MSVLFDVIFVALGGLAAYAIVATFRQALPALGGLCAALQEPTARDEIRLTLREHRVFIRTPRSPLRHRHGPKPVTHRLNSRSPRAAA